MLRKAWYWIVFANLALAGSADAQRTLHWRQFDVDAHLDADGMLHVIERQTMVMTGDWNGGERTFRLHPGQPFALESITRIDTAADTAEAGSAEAGSAIPLVQGGLAYVDHYDWSGGHSLRWRSRLPSDPPFDNTAITYELRYQIGEVIIARGDRYVLDHNFSIPARVGPIEHFTLDLDIDPVWSAPSLEPSLRLDHLAPGDSAPVRAELTYLGAAIPSAIRHPRSTTPVFIIWGLGLAAILWLYRRWLAIERPLGRFESVAPLVDPDAAWLDSHVFRLLPEEVGALWDQKVGPTEVTAVFARLEAEGKIESAVEKRGMLSGRVLRLTRKVHIAEFDPHVRPLMRRIFFDDRRVVDTAALNKHYRSKGFNPTEHLEPAIEQRVKLSKDRREPLPKIMTGWPLWLAGPLFIAADLILRRGEVFVPTGPNSADAHVLWVILTGALLVLLGLIGLGVATNARRRVADAERWTWPLPLGAAAALSALMALQAAARHQLWSNTTAGVLGLLGMATLVLAICLGCLHGARSRLHREGIARRRPLLAARRWFADQLESREPHLEDDWFPYLIAFGLGPRMDHWFKSFGSASSSATVGSGGSWSGGGSSGGGSGWSGGGGSFGGGGASAAWTSAAAGMAGGVTAASSSSGGSSGGGSSSGGGGGGGW